MQELSIEMVQQIDGEGFWGGFLCGAGLAASAYVLFTPDPVGKLAMYTVLTSTAGACGLALT